MNSVVPLSSERRDHPALGIATLVGNLFLMACISAMVKYLSTRYPLGEILMFRFIFAALMFWTILLASFGFVGLRTQRPFDHAFRSVIGLTSLALLFFALTRIPIADATALVYAAPIFITVLSIFVLGETIGFRRWIAVFVGFFGVILIAQPGGESWNIGVAAAVTSAVTAALVAIWLRRLSSSEKSATIGVYYNSLGTLVCVGWVAWFGGVMPPIGDWWIWFGFRSNMRCATMVAEYLFSLC